ncbi:hypothetical protein EMCG_07489 [[Emmonsia] crescens]|uniref:Uncharacterized protein n=1 Tax=[Emmonsia] crescens TaxID=73230 RepID=A0A0G2JB42_9EURO|nr:hypothetical protein EMCG_07489 [Emmonsia crescens UAMH 3008]
MILYENVFLDTEVHEIILSDNSCQLFIIMCFIVNTLDAHIKTVTAISALHSLL